MDLLPLLHINSLDQIFVLVHRESRDVVRANEEAGDPCVFFTSIEDARASKDYYEEEDDEFEIVELKVSRP